MKIILEILHFPTLFIRKILALIGGSIAAVFALILSQIIFFLVRLFAGRILKKVMKDMQQKHSQHSQSGAPPFGQPQQEQPTTEKKSGKLVQDPMCGLNLVEEDAYRLTGRGSDAGQVYYFCSQECLDQFIEEKSKES